MLTGKTAVVTGAGRGIGKEIALALAKSHANVIINYNGSKNRAEETAAEIEALGGLAEAVQCDVSDSAACAKMFSYILEKYKKIDILVNNAGITKDGLLGAMKEEDFDAVIRINLKGVFNCIHEVYRPMLKQRSGRIINISSVSGVIGNAGQANYSASKAGVIGLTKTAAKELAGRSITVNAIAPGFIGTDMTDALNERAKNAGLEVIPMKRFGKASEVASLAVFLASEGAGYITGQVICVDGGMAM